MSFVYKVLNTKENRFYSRNGGTGTRIGASWTNVGHLKTWLKHHGAWNDKVVKFSLREVGSIDVDSFKNGTGFIPTKSEVEELNEKLGDK
jgi:hypothetical protein